MSPNHRVLLVDDDAIVREAIRTFLSRQEDFELCGEARDGDEAVQAYASFLPDIVLMDLQMPGVSGVKATEIICERWPSACVLVMTTFGTREYVTTALRAGAAGYVLKDVGAEGLLSSLRQALAGEMPLSASVRRQLVADVVAAPKPTSEPPVPLSPRETELLQYLAQGLTNQQIGSVMYLSEGSVKQYLSHVGDKLQARTRTQILIKSIQCGVVDPNMVTDD